MTVCGTAATATTNGTVSQVSANEFRHCMRFTANFSMKDAPQSAVMFWLRCSFAFLLSHRARGECRILIIWLLERRFSRGTSCVPVVTLELAGNGR